MPTPSLTYFPHRKAPPHLLNKSNLLVDTHFNPYRAPPEKGSALVDTVMGPARSTSSLSKTTLMATLGKDRLRILGSYYLCPELISIRFGLTSAMSRQTWVGILGALAFFPKAFSPSVTHECHTTSRTDTTSVNPLSSSLLIPNPTWSSRISISKNSRSYPGNPNLVPSPPCQDRPWTIIGTSVKNDWRLKSFTRTNPTLVRPFFPFSTPIPSSFRLKYSHLRHRSNEVLDVARRTNRIPCFDPLRGSRSPRCSLS